MLGGTAEALALMARLASERPEARAILSLAGRTLAPRRPVAGEVRIGGFGGAEGLARFMENEAVTHLVDATHPYAVGMSRNAAEAARRAGVPHLALLRPPWEREPGDRWQVVSCLRAARDALPIGARPFLALGAGHVAPFRHRPDLRPVLRRVDAPAEPMPFAADLVLGRPSSDPVEEAALFSDHGVTHLVCRNSGGHLSHAKIAAARVLGLPVVMIERPPGAEAPSVSDIDGVMGWLRG